jgi:hypothetical protein
MKTFAKTFLVITVAILGGGLAFWAVFVNKAREIDKLAKDALCVLELQGGKPECSASFTTSRTIDRFYVGARPGAKGERLWLSFSGDKASFSGPVTRPTRFTCGREIPRGTYKVALRQEAGSSGGLVVIAGDEPPVHVTGWQILSRTFLALLVLSGIWALIARKSKNPRRRAGSVCLFQMLLLALVVVFFYLLFHEGGHALGAMLFGRFDWARSDFWGIHGHPHAGVTLGPGLEAWQQAIITGGGPMLPTFAGWAFFLLWSWRIRRGLRGKRPIVDLYLSAIVAMLVLPSVVVAGCLLGIIEDNETQSFIANTPGPVWLVQVILWGILLVNVVVLWRIVPELWRVWRTQVENLRNLPTQ